MARIIRIVLLLPVSLGLFAGALGLSGFASERPVRHTAVVAGYVQVCGGPAPGRCRTESVGFCQPPRGCVTADRVAAVNASGRRVASQRLRHGRFKLHLVPGRYTIELLGDGKRTRGQVMQRKRVWARAHRRTAVRFSFDVP